MLHLYVPKSYVDWFGVSDDSCYDNNLCDRMKFSQYSWEIHWVYSGTRTHQKWDEIRRRKQESRMKDIHGITMMSRAIYVNFVHFMVVDFPFINIHISQMSICNARNISPLLILLGIIRIQFAKILNCFILHSGYIYNSLFYYSSVAIFAVNVVALF